MIFVHLGTGNAIAHTFTNAHLIAKRNDFRSLCSRSKATAKQTMWQREKYAVGLHLWTIHNHLDSERKRHKHTHYSAIPKASALRVSEGRELNDVKKQTNPTVRSGNGKRSDVEKNELCSFHSVQLREHAIIHSLFFCFGNAKNKRSQLHLIPFTYRSITMT